jgi:hypothetical protein
VKATPYWMYARRGGAGGARTSGSTATAAASSAAAQGVAVSSHASATAIGPRIRPHNTPRGTTTGQAYLAHAQADFDGPRGCRMGQAAPACRRPIQRTMHEIGSSGPSLAPPKQTLEVGTHASASAVAHALLASAVSYVGISTRS